jgi:hypothetical protein
MKLIELDPEFLKIDSNGHYVYTPTLAYAQGLKFLCPLCFQKNKGTVGTHVVVIWFRNHGVPDDTRPLPGRWCVSGIDMNDLTITPSINLENATKTGCQWHGFVTNGEAA